MFKMDPQELGLETSSSCLEGLNWKHLGRYESINNYEDSISYHN